MRGWLCGLVLWALGNVACASSIVASSLGEPVKLNVGEAALIAGEELTVGFTAVRDDSRCGPDVVCIWEGVATVVAWASRPGQGRAELLLHTTDNGGFSTRREYLDYEIQVVSLSPPNDGDVAQSEYEVTLVVRRR